MTESFWQPIETAPKTGQVILLRGPAGYKSIPYRCKVGYWMQNIYVTEGGFWVGHSGDWFTEDGEPPDAWAPLPPA